MAYYSAMLSRNRTLYARAQGSYTALHDAAKEGQPSVLRALLAAGASVEDTNRHGHTALHVASRRGCKVWGVEVSVWP